MNKINGKVFVWPLCTRMIHWIIASSFTIAFITSFNKEYFTLHIAFGYVFCVVLSFRIIWGFIGPSYATFNTFQLQFYDLKHYFAEKMKDRWRKIHPGHNPASSWFTIIVLSLGYIIVLGGILLYGIQEGSGPLAFLNAYYYNSSYVLLSLHTYMSYLLVLSATVHIIGVLIEQFYHKTHMLFAMISGYKNCEGKDTKISQMRNIFAYGVIALSVSLFYFIMSDSESILTKNRFQKIDFEQENSIFYEKCGKCHKNYPPYMLPNESWVKLFDGLENHFGEKITENNISKSEQMSIKNYVLSHSGETSTRKISFKTLDSLGDMRPLSITKSPYWRASHKDIDPTIFKNPLVKDKSNCFVCHHNFEYGIFDNNLIKIPR